MFLWLPSVRLFERNPFTMVSSSSPEFVIRVYDGFTRDLYSLAQQKLGQVFRCSMDVGYGQVPNFMDFDRAILVAGGSGASFTFAIALDLIEQLPSRNVSSPIGFLRVVRSLGKCACAQCTFCSRSVSESINLS